jgi:hypothetical protein
MHYVGKCRAFSVKAPAACIQHCEIIGGCHMHTMRLTSPGIRICFQQKFCEVEVIRV